MIKPPSRHHQFAIGHDIAGNTFVAIKIGQHVDYIYGMFKGRELRGGHLDAIESWHLEGEQVPFEGHPTKGAIVLEMGVPVKEFVGDEAQAIIAKIIKQNEWNYRYQEWLGMLCEDGQPTELEKQMATDCADEVLPF